MNHDKDLENEIELDRIAIADLQKRVRSIVDRGGESVRLDRQRDDLNKLKRSIKATEARRSPE
jgi:hypothetical protein